MRHMITTVERTILLLLILIAGGCSDTQVTIPPLAPGKPLAESRGVKSGSKVAIVCVVTGAIAQYDVTLYRYKKTTSDRVAVGVYSEVSRALLPARPDLLSKDQLSALLDTRFESEMTRRGLRVLDRKNLKALFDERDLTIAIGSSDVHKLNDVVPGADVLVIVSLNAPEFESFVGRSTSTSDSQKCTEDRIAATIFTLGIAMIPALLDPGDTQTIRELEVRCPRVWLKASAYSLQDGSILWTCSHSLSARSIQGATLHATARYLEENGALDAHVPRIDELLDYAVKEMVATILIE